MSAESNTKIQEMQQENAIIDEETVGTQELEFSPILGEYDTELKGKNEEQSEANSEQNEGSDIEFENENEGDDDEINEIVQEMTSTDQNQQQHEVIDCDEEDSDEEREKMLPKNIKIDHEVNVKITAESFDKLLAYDMEAIPETYNPINNGEDDEIQKKLFDQWFEKYNPKRVVCYHSDIIDRAVVMKGIPIYYAEYIIQLEAKIDSLRDEIIKMDQKEFKQWKRMMHDEDEYADLVRKFNRKSLKCLNLQRQLDNKRDRIKQLKKTVKSLRRRLDSDDE